MNRTPIIINPQMADYAIAEMQHGLVDNLAWLDVAFGRAERLVTERNGRKYYTPNVYSGGNEYISIMPDSNIGNYCFFWLSDPQEMELITAVQAGFTATLSVIFWFDMRRVGGSADYRNKEAVKAEILAAFNGGFVMHGGSFTVRRCYELAENIFREFTLDEVQNQYLMQPYCGFRFEGQFKYKQTCI